MTRLYVSGKIAGLESAVARSAFNLACHNLAAAGYQPVDPHYIPANCGGTCIPDLPESEHSWACYLRFDIIDMLRCDGVALLDNWNDSKGAILELFVARQCGLPIKLVSEWLGIV